MKRISATNPMAKKQRGQGMSEYIIITALIAVAAIGVFAAFGDVIGNQTAAMAQEMSGNSGQDEVDAAGDNADQASTYAQQQDNLSTYNGQNNQ
ncbi:Flp family type IVb pilin [Shewanella chilikensis]|uniref:Flp family type IVb pilin n=1 Tax=Shewanella chilikensis TaxID=558541 RepID=UPI003A96A723